MDFPLLVEHPQIPQQRNEVVELALVSFCFLSPGVFRLLK